MGPRFYVLIPVVAVAERGLTMRTIRLGGDISDRNINYSLSLAV